MAAIGGLVVSLDHRSLGVGKVVAQSESSVTIEYFDSAADPVAERVEVPSDRVREAPLGRQQRVWFKSQGSWHVGRVVDGEFARCRVRPPGDQDDVWLAVDDLYVRWDRPLESPVAVMQTKAFETPHHYFARRSFMDATLEQQAAARGNCALTSSAIEFYQHQIDVATRVLSDPVRRFLLADEVGMGKTIEAGIVVRQQLLDHPDSYVRVLVPTRLRDQWRRELEERFFVGDFTEARVEVVDSFDDESWTVTPDETPDLVVVDEAHHVAKWAHGSRRRRSRFESATELAHAARGLLLLSATPVAHNEATYLGMLHLLDPDNFDMGDLERFRQRVEQRHELARVFVLFRPGQMKRRLERNAERFAKLLGDDAESSALLDRVIGLCRGEDQEELDDAIRALRISVTDRHRIHHRMLRSRRDATDDFPVRGRRLGRVLVAERGQADELTRWIDRWRDAVVIDAESQDDQQRIQLFRILLDRALAFPLVLRALVQYRFDSSVGPDIADLTADETETLDAVPVGETERMELERFLERDWSERTDVRIKSVADFVWEIPRRRKVVVFTSFTASASLILAALRETFPRDQVAAHLLSDSIEEGRRALQTFKDDRSCNVLVCDRSAEEGINLQFADVLVHAELPIDPNRLEQRIGRLDRHGPDTPVENAVLVDGAIDSYLDAWFGALKSGLEIFDRSVASYQFVIDRVAAEFVAAVFEGGASGLAPLALSVPDQLEAERREISEQDQLDAIEAIDLTAPVMGGLREVDARWEEFEDWQERLICRGKGHLRFTRRDHPRRSGVCSYWRSHPFKGGEPLVPDRDLMTYMNGALSKRDRVLNGAYERRVALEHPGTRVWAAGDPFIDGLLAYARERDDRGRAYAFWKPQPDLDEEAVLAALRFDFIVEPDPTAFDEFDPDSATVLQRRAASLLVPYVETVWIDVDGAEVTEKQAAVRLRAKYLPNFGHIRLSQERWRLVDAVLPGLAWERWCGDSFQTAQSLVRDRDGMVDRVAAAGETAKRQGIARVEALRRRSQLFGGDYATEFEASAVEAVARAVADPRLVLDAMGFVLVTRDRPKVEHG